MPTELFNKLDITGIAPFLIALRRLLCSNHCDIIRWSSCGLCVEVLNVQALVETLLPQYGFRQSKWTSFQRRLNTFGFRKRSRGVTDLISYYNTFFCRGRPEDMRRIVRSRQSVNLNSPNVETASAMMTCIPPSPAFIDNYSPDSSYFPMPRCSLPLNREEMAILQLVATIASVRTSPASSSSSSS